MSDFIYQQQSDELVDGQYYNGEYQPTDQDLADMAEAWADHDHNNLWDQEVPNPYDMSDDADALASAGWGMDEDYNNVYEIDSIAYEPFEGFDF